MKTKQMTIKRAVKEINRLTTKLVSTNKEYEMDKIERKINILKDFIYFQRELAGVNW